MRAMGNRWSWLAALLLAACSSKAPPGGRAGDGSSPATGHGSSKLASENTMSTIETLARSAGPDVGVNPWLHVAVPGVELFTMGNTLVYRGVAVIDGNAGAPLEGKAAFRAVVSRGVTDPSDLASLALLFFGRGSLPIRHPDEVRGQPSEIVTRIAPPAIEGNTLVFWGFDETAEDVIRYRLDLASLVLEQQRGADLLSAGVDPVSRAQADLASGSASGYDTAINALVAACGDPRAASTLNVTIARHPYAKARAWAAFQAALCHDEQTVASLIAALEGDADATVRKNAADTLGKLGATAARGALEKAAADPDASVRGAAGRALAKIP